MSFNLSNLIKSRQPALAISKPAPVRQDDHPIRSGVCHALVFLGMGIEGVSCGGDFTPSGKF